MLTKLTLFLLSIYTIRIINKNKIIKNKYEIVENIKKRELFDLRHIDRPNDAVWSRDDLLKIDNSKINYGFIVLFIILFIISHFKLDIINNFIILNFGIYLFSFLLGYYIINYKLRQLFGNELPWILRNINIVKIYKNKFFFFLFHLLCITIFIYMILLRLKYDKAKYLGTISVVFIVITMFIRDGLKIDKLIIIVPVTSIILYFYNRLFLKSISFLNDCIIHWRVFFFFSIIICIINKIKKGDDRNIFNQIMINNHHKDNNYSIMLNIIPLLLYLIMVPLYSKYGK